MKLSVIIPAYNEEKLITRCVTSVFESLQAKAQAGLEAEVIITDNNSSDATAELARKAGARVVFEPIQQISRSRNAGAKVATGDWFLFIDGDSILHPDSLADMLAHIETGRYVGGGCVVGLDQAPLRGRIAVRVWNITGRFLKWPAGSFIFCRADAFREIGCFSEEFYAAEELIITKALKRWGRSRGLRFTMLHRQRHISSGRKFYLYSSWEVWRLVLRALFLPKSTLRQRKHLDLFYDGRR